MNNRIEIKIAVVGEPGSGKETFCRMLFLDNNPKIRVDPLGNLGEIYMEIDPVNIKNNSKKIVEECKERTEYILKQNDIKDLDKLRNIGYDPFFYKYTNRVRGLVNSHEKSQHININVLVTYYFIGNNYEKFSKELDAANMIIYLVDVNNYNPESRLFGYIINLVKNSKEQKYMMTLVNKCDDINQSEEYDVNNSKHQIIAKIEGKIKTTAEQFGIQHLLSPAIPISCKYATIFRQINYGIPAEFSKEDKIFISNLLTVKKERLEKHIFRNNDRYLKRTGFTKFRDNFINVLSGKYKIMLENNLNNELDNLKTMPQEDTKKFVASLSAAKNRAEKLTKILRKDFEKKASDVVTELIHKIIYSPEPNMNLIEELKKFYYDDEEIIKVIDAMKNQMYEKFISSITKKLYSEQLTQDIFIPSKVHKIFDELYSTSLSKNETITLATHICELYGKKARTLMGTNINLLYETYFDVQECKKIMSMLNEIKSIIKFDDYKLYLIQILITKMMVGQKYVEDMHCEEKEIPQNIISYFKSLKYYLSQQKNSNFIHLFGNLRNVCEFVIFNYDKELYLEYIANNIQEMISFEFEGMIEIDKFIIKMIKKINYHAAIKEEIDSDGDSDVDIYNQDETDNTSFHFTKDDLINSDSDILMEEIRSDEKKSRRKNTSDIVVV